MSQWGAPPLFVFYILIAMVDSTPSDLFKSPEALLLHAAAAAATAAAAAAAAAAAG